MQKTDSSNKNNKLEVWFYYLIINCAFFVPFLVCTLLPQIGEPIVNFLWPLFLVYWIPFIFYYLFGLPYLHCVISLGFLVFGISKLNKEITQKRFFQILFLTAVSIALNIYWAMNGKPFTVV